MHSRRRHDQEHGQVIVLFALAIVAMLAMGALLFNGAQTLVLRRQLQNAGDAAALSAGNVMTNSTATCTAARISPSAVDGSNDLYLAARSSVEANLGWSDAQVAARMTVSCPTDSQYTGLAVRVSLSSAGPSYFGGGSLTVSTSSTAMNGQDNSGDFSVALLDPSNTSWPSTRRGCPSWLVNGGITASFEGSIIVDSKCTRSDNTNAAMKAQNSAFTMTMVNNSTIQVAGEIASGTAAHITPTPVEHYRPLLPDKLALKDPCNAVDLATSNCIGNNGSLPTVNMSSSGSGICKNQDPCILTPGTYTGGIAAGGGGSAGTLLLRPGVYWMRGGGLSLKSGSARVFSIPYGTSTTGYTDATALADFATTKTDLQVEQQFIANCPAPTLVNPLPSTCGNLLYNGPSSSSSSWNTNQDAVSVGAQGIFEIRAYNPANDEIIGNRTLFTPYKNVVIWQAHDPPFTGSGQNQPTIAMTGGACVTLSGTVYAPEGQIQFGGGSCGSGGGDTNLKLQFICWDLTLAGNNDFYFAFSKDWFAKPTTYGLVQ
jgi:Flp pilus assembly protein TadG